MERLTKAFRTLTLRGLGLRRDADTQEGETQTGDIQKEGTRKEETKKRQNPDWETPLDNLGKVWDAAKSYKSPCMSLALLEDLGVRVNHLLINDDGTYADPENHHFFDPWDVVFYTRQELPSDDESIKSEKFERVARPESTAPGGYFDSSFDMSESLIHDFSRTVTVEGEKSTLWSLTEWWERGNLIPDIFLPAYEARLFGNAWQPNKGWSTRQANPLPHIMLHLIHDRKGNDHDLLRAEVLTIVATITSRISVGALNVCENVPVMVFSFMGREGRILQAHLNDARELVILRSRLYKFPKGDKKAKNLFLQFMSSDPCV